MCSPGGLAAVVRLLLRGLGLTDTGVAGIGEVLGAACVTVAVCAAVMVGAGMDTSERRALVAAVRAPFHRMGAT
jgi:hypothetical protein